MADTSIEWTEKTWNPTVGCSVLSPGCSNCYAMRMARRLEAMGRPEYIGLTQVVNGNPVWTGKVGCLPDRLEDPIRWRKPRRVFVNSMSDLFHEGVPDSFIGQVFAVMALAPQHSFQILTKRPERMRDYLLTSGTPDRIVKEANRLTDAHIRPLDGWLYHDIAEFGWPLPNVWLGTSVEDQKRADERIPLLLQTPAAVRFISAEPLLGPLDLMRYLPHPSWDPDLRDPWGQQWPRRIHWLIAGGESGPGARECDVQWIASLIDQCKAAAVPIFVKQLGADPLTGEQPSDRRRQFPGPGFWNDGVFRPTLHDRKGGDMAEWPEALRVREFPAVAEACPDA